MPGKKGGSVSGSKGKDSKQSSWAAGTGIGGPTATSANAPEGSLRVMRKSTWDRLTSSVKMREYNTTSYAKYKASKRKGRTSAKEMKQQ